jgi:hypothetical protein
MGLDASATKHQAVATKEQREEGVHQHLPGSLLPDEANVTNNASKDDVVVTDNDVCLYDGGDIQSDNPGNAFFLAEVKKVVDKYKSTDWNEKMHIVESLMRKVTEKKGRFLVGSKRKSKMAANPNAPSHKWLELLDMGCRRKVSSVLEHLTATPFDDAAASGPNDDGQVQRARDHFNDNLAEVVQAPIETPRVKRGSSDSSLGKAVRRTKQHHDDDATSAAFTALASASPALVNDLLGIIQLPTPSNQQFDRGPINSISSSALGRFSPFSFGSEADTHALACHLPKTLPVHAQPSRAQTESGNRSKTSPPMASTTTTKPAAKAAASTAVADGLSTTAIGKPAEANQVKQPSISAARNGCRRMTVCQPWERNCCTLANKTTIFLVIMFVGACKSMLFSTSHWSESVVIW